MTITVALSFLFNPMSHILAVFLCDIGFSTIQSPLLPGIKAKANVKANAKANANAKAETNNREQEIRNS